jgi:hypothetical protein
MDDTLRKIIEGPMENVHETLCSPGCRDAFFFYSGAFIIDLHWGLFWYFLPSYLGSKQYFSSTSLTWLLLFVPLCCIPFGFLFGALTSIQQSSHSRQSTTVLLVIFGIGLGVSSLGFSIIPTFFQTSGNNNLVYGLVMGCFFLIAISISGYTASFFSLSLYFSNQIVSISALPFWAALGQLASIGIVYISSNLSNSPFQLLTIFAIDCLLILIFTAIFWIFVRKTLPISEGLGKSQAFSSLLRSRFGPEFLKDFKNYFSMGVFFSILLFALFSNGFLFSVELRIESWLKFFNPLMDDDKLPLYRRHLDFIQIRLYQQIVQLAASILFFLLEFRHVKYHINQRPSFSQDESHALANRTEKFKFHVDWRMYGFYEAQWSIFFFASIALLFLCFMDSFPSIYEDLFVLLGLLFALTGFGRTLIYSGRELQRSSMRLVRHRKNYAYTEDSVDHFDFFDSFIQTGFYSTFLSLGQILTILMMNLLSDPLVILVFMSGSVLLMMFWIICYLNRTFRPINDLKNDLIVTQDRNSKVVQAKMFNFRPTVVLQAPKKHLY